MHQRQVGLTGWQWTAAVALGMLGGLGIFTFQYAEGLSYFSTDPAVCRNCHIMNDHFDSWRQAGHRNAAGCVDCHLPQTFVAKYLAKAENGYYHAKGFTLQDFHEPIRIKDSNSQILQDNCLRCHGDLVHQLVRGSTWAEGAIRCVNCHRGVGHGAPR